MSERINTAQFKEKIFDYESNKEWKYAGELPAIVDFYADWCGPCKMVGPVLDKVAEEYSGKLAVYKVDTDKEQELSQVFGIQSIPTLLFIPMEGEPQAAMGALPKAAIDKAIKDVLKIE